jgi:hypothetical protein
MAPLLRTGDTVRVQPRNYTLQTPPTPGSLVLLERDGELVVHRIVAVHGDRWLERGDRHGPRRSVAPEALLGVVDRRRRGERQRPLRPPLRYRLRNLLASFAGRRR